MKLELIIYGMWALGAVAMASLVFHAIKNRGLKGAIFGAPIARTVGELDPGKIGPMRTTLKLHRLESRVPGAPTVGLEVVNRSVVSYHSSPIRLTSEQVAVLRELLSQAVADGQG